MNDLQIEYVCDPLYVDLFNSICRTLNNENNGVAKHSFRTIFW